MAFQVETTTDIDPLTDALQAVIDRQEITENSFRNLRELLYRLSPLNDEQVDQIFAAHRQMPAGDGLWLEFFLDSLTDVFLTSRGDQIHLSDGAEDRLFRAIGVDDPITDAGHRRLALRLLLRATQVSEHYRSAVLKMVHHHLMHDDQRLLINLARQAAVIDIVDLQLVRKLVFGAGGQYDLAIGRSVADFLLELDQAKLTFTDQEAWRSLFIKAMSAHLLQSAGCREHAPCEIDDDASLWLVEQVNAGRSGRTVVALIQQLIERNVRLPESLQALAADVD